MSNETFRLGVDIGGTFTDLVLLGETRGRLEILKVPSVPRDPAAAVLAGTQALLARTGVEAGAVSLFIHGTTLAVNTLLQRIRRPGGAHRDPRIPRPPRAAPSPAPRGSELLHGEARGPGAAAPGPRGQRASPDVRASATGRSSPPRWRRRPTSSSGPAAGPSRSASSTATSTAATSARRPGIIRARHPDVYVSTSHELWPQRREYERGLVTVVNAHVGGAHAGVLRAAGLGPARPRLLARADPVHALERRRDDGALGRRPAGPHAVQRSGGGRDGRGVGRAAGGLGARDHPRHGRHVGRRVGRRRRAGLFHGGQRRRVPRHHALRRHLVDRSGRRLDRAGGLRAAFSRWVPSRRDPIRGRPATGGAASSRP